jgi:hypothetical protein
MEEVIVALLYLFALSRARDYFESRYDRTLALLEDQENNTEIQGRIDERIRGTHIHPV